MKKFMFKLVFWLILIGIIGLACYQNIDYFLVRYAFKIDYYFGVFIFPETYSGIYMSALFLAGFIIASFFSLLSRFRNYRTIKSLKHEIAFHKKSVADLKNRLSTFSLKPETGQDETIQTREATTG